MICLSSAGGPTSFQMLRKFVCLSTGMQACADSTLNEFTFENVTTALSALAEAYAAGFRVLSSLAIEGHLSH